MDSIDVLSLMIGFLAALQTWQIFVLTDLRERIKRLEDKYIRGDRDA